jgi:TP901 family phage tail tape measure protein
MTDIASLGIEVDSGDVKTATTDLDKLETQSGQSEKANKSLGGSFKSLAVAAAATAIAYKSISASFNVWREFSASISELSAITGAVGKDLEYLKRQSELIGEATTLSATQASQAFKLIASAKPDLLESAEALAAVTKQAVTLAEAAGLDLPTAANALGASLNQFSADADEAAKFINILAAGSKYGASEIGATANALREAGTVASSAGLSFEETNAAIQQLASVAIKGSQAGTNLRNIIVNLRTAGIDAINPSIVGLSQAFKNLADRNLEVTELTKLFGKENLASGEALIKSADKMDILTKKLTGTSVAIEQARVRTNNLDGDIKRMGSAWESAGILLGETFDPALRAVTQSFGVVAKVAQSFIIALNDMGSALGAYAAVAASVMSLNFEQASAILELREEERKKNDERITQIWAEKAATDELNASKQAGATTTAETAAAEPPIVAADPYEHQAILDKLRQRYADELLLLAEKQNSELMLIQDAEDNKALTEQQAEEMRVNLVQSYADQRVEIARRKAEKEKQIEQSKNAIMIGMAGNLASLMNSKSRHLFKIGKAAAIAGAMIKGYESILNSYAAGTKIGGPILGAAFAATAGIATAVQIQNIKSQSFGGGGAAPGAGGMGGSPATATPPGSTAIDNSDIFPTEQTSAPLVQELRVVLPEDGAHTPYMRQFAEQLAETIEDMGGVGSLVIS